MMLIKKDPEQNRILLLLVPPTLPWALMWGTYFLVPFHKYLNPRLLVFQI